jgi:serine/threonine protein kinase
VHLYFANTLTLSFSAQHFNAVLGSGKFGKVNLGEWWGTAVALKTLENFDLEENHELFQKGVKKREKNSSNLFVLACGLTPHRVLLRCSGWPLCVSRAEIKMMKELHHPHVVQFLGYSNITSIAKLVIVMEYMPFGSVEGYLSAHPATSLATRVRWCNQMAQALAYLHNRKPTFLIHRKWVDPIDYLKKN